MSILQRSEAFCVIFSTFVSVWARTLLSSNNVSKIFKSKDSFGSAAILSLLGDLPKRVREMQCFKIVSRKPQFHHVTPFSFLRTVEQKGSSEWILFFRIAIRWGLASGGDVVKHGRFEHFFRAASIVLSNLNHGIFLRLLRQTMTQFRLTGLKQSLNQPIP